MPNTGIVPNPRPPAEWECLGKEGRMLLQSDAGGGEWNARIFGPRFPPAAGCILSKLAKLGGAMSALGSEHDEAAERLFR